MKPRVRYYSSLTSDDFAGTDIRTEQVPADYRYIEKNPIYLAGSFFAYRIFAKPLVTLYIKARFHQRFVNRKALKKAGKSGAFIYGNHTLLEGDAFIPNMLSFGKRNYIIAGADAVSIPGIRTLVKMLGAIPLAGTPDGYREFRKCISARVKEGSTVTIYPEAHIWPYYTGVRPFSSVSFHYPVETGMPVYVLTNTYHRRFGIFPWPRIVSYIDGPFYPDSSLPKKKAMEALCSTTYETMKKRSKESDYEYIRYIKRA